MWPNILMNTLDGFLSKSAQLKQSARVQRLLLTLARDTVVRVPPCLAERNYNQNVSTVHFSSRVLFDLSLALASFLSLTVRSRLLFFSYFSFSQVFFDSRDLSLSVLFFTCSLSFLCCFLRLRTFLSFDRYICCRFLVLFVSLLGFTF